MAVKYKELKQKLEGYPLTAQEIKYIDAAEKYIDGELIRKFDNRRVYIDMNVFEFRSIPSQYSTINDIKDTRKRIMRKELESRFKAAGWNLEDEFADGSMGFDYVVFTGKK